MNLMAGGNRDGRFTGEWLNDDPLVVTVSDPCSVRGPTWRQALSGRIFDHELRRPSRGRYDICRSSRVSAHPCVDKQNLLAVGGPSRPALISADVPGQEDRRTALDRSNINLH